MGVGNPTSTAHRARISQIMMLNHLAPDIQEALLFLPRVESGRDVVRERDVREIAVRLNWDKQRSAWTR